MSTKLRGPYSIQELSVITGMDIETLRKYQQQGVIPKRRMWGNDAPKEVFYKVDIDRLLHERGPGGSLAFAETSAQNDLLRKVSRIVNAQRRLYPELSAGDVLAVLRNVAIQCGNRTL